MNKDHNKLFPFLRVPGVEPTNNHAERSVRSLVIMRKTCFGTRSPAGLASHRVLPSQLETARRQGKNRIDFLTALLTPPIHLAPEALLPATTRASTPRSSATPPPPDPAQPHPITHTGQIVPV